MTKRASETPPATPAPAPCKGSLEELFGFPPGGTLEEVIDDPQAVYEGILQLRADLAERPGGLAALPGGCVHFYDKTGRCTFCHRSLFE